MKYTITLSGDALQTIGAALGEMPYKSVAHVLVDIQRQVNEQENTASDRMEASRAA